MKKSIIVLVAFLCMSTYSYAQNCNAGSRIANRAWNQTGPWTNPVSIVPFVTQFKIKQAIWNTIVGNSQARWGARHIEIDKKATGTVQGGTKRTFVSNPLFYDNLKITLNKTGGRGRTVVLVCTHDSDGNSEAIREYTFQNSALSSSKQFQIPNIRGKIVSIAISCKTALRSFTYDIELENKDQAPANRRSKR